MAPKASRLKTCRRSKPSPERPRTSSTAAPPKSGAVWFCTRVHDLNPFSRLAVAERKGLAGKLDFRWLDLGWALAPAVVKASFTTTSSNPRRHASRNIILSQNGKPPVEPPTPQHSSQALQFNREIIVRPMSHLPPPICYSEGRR